MKMHLKTISVVLVLQFSMLALSAQSFIPQPDKSPMDMSYFPHNYPVLKIQDKISDPPQMRVIYSRPQKAGRTVFGGLVEYGKIWRLGANEATEIEFFIPVKIGNKKISRGRYTLYAIPYENQWTLILNKTTDTWGTFKYDEKKDVLRIDLPVNKAENLSETLSMAFEKTGTGCQLHIAWDNVRVALPVIF